MKKRCQIFGQPVLYVLLLIIFTFILLSGYSFIKDIGEKGEKTKVILFKSDLENDVNSVDYGSVKVETYGIPVDVDKICFSDPKDTNPLLCKGCPKIDEDPIVINTIRDNVKENLFLISGGLPEGMEIEEITIGCCEFMCFDVNKGQVKLRLEGQGNEVLIKNV